MLRGATAPGLDVVLHHDADVVTLPGPVVRALGDAVGEALRNAARHGGVTTAAVTVAAGGGGDGGDGGADGGADDDGDTASRGVSVVVSDTGRGFDPATTRASYGLRESVRRRAALVGADVRVDSAPGRGTRVSLSWSADVAAEHEDDGGGSRPLGARLRRWAGDDGRTPSLTRAAGDPRPAVAGAIVPFALLALAWGVAGIGQGQPPWLLGWAALLCVAGAWLLVRGEERARLPWLALLQLLALAGAVGYLLGAPPGALVTGFAWPISLAALAAVITAMYRPGWVAVAASGALVLAVATFAVLTDPDRSPAALVPALPAIASCIWPVAVGVTGRAVMIALGRRDEQQTRAAHAALARAHAARSRRAALDRRLLHLQDLLDPALGAVARGEAEPGDPAVVRRAVAAEQVARDELQVPWLLTPALRDAVAAARGRGTEVVFTTTSDLVTTPRVARDLLTAVLATGVTTSRVQLTVADDDAPVTLVVAVEDPADRAAVVTALRGAAPDVREIGTIVLARGDRPAPEPQPR
ncbi:hypothetical protein C8046_09305 [Serinibacter arcticus]|uniref:Histidine kinase/HSP90-like ATPase domain-containing protein n=1 Tax=Serinibacter arcticus TaxID=1655435 RepID=A0A2U1ZV08_9MICO|nr:hypothetical protein [Serinibacter arcticus]PWD50814.1 hypothetical protein C8046_09305 [Serinibacter arcticus]